MGYERSSTTMDSASTSEETFSASEETLQGVIKSLNETTRRIDGLIFGERPSVQEDKNPVAGDKITQLRNELLDILKGLNVIVGRFELLGGK